MMKKEFTAEQLLDRWEIRREVQNIMGKYSQSYCIKQEGDLGRFWSKRDDVSFGVNDGYYVGQAAVLGYYAALKNEIAAASRLIRERFPKKLEGKTEEECFGVGQISYRPIDTPVIEIAADGQTAKGIWVVRGLVERVTTAGPVSFWDYSYWAADFLLEDGVWKIWHLLDLHEVFSRQGVNFTDRPQPLPDDPAFAEMAQVVIPQPNRPMVLRRTYRADRPFTPSPRVPEPYRTFAETFSYGV